MFNVFDFYNVHLELELGKTHDVVPADHGDQWMLQNSRNGTSQQRGPV
jgi:hypothetical protein